MRREEEKILIERSLEGEMDAFGELISEHQERAYATAFQVLGNHADAADLLQEAFIKAHKSLRSFRKEARFYTWFYRIMINLCINHKKKRARGLAVVPIDHKLEATLNNKARPLEGLEMNH